MPEVAKKVVSEEKVPIFVPEEEEEEFIPEEIVPERGTWSFLASHSWHLLCSSLFLVVCDSYICFGGSLWSCSMFLSCFYVHNFTAPKEILTHVCQIISLKSQRFLRNLSQRKKHVYLHLRNGNFLQQKVHVNSVLLFSFIVSV